MARDGGTGKLVIVKIDKSKRDSGESDASSRSKDRESCGKAVAAREI